MRLNPAALAALIERSGFSKATFAAEAAISPGHLSDLLSGRRNPSPAVTKRLAEALAVPQPAILADPSRSK